MELNGKAPVAYLHWGRQLNAGFAEHIAAHLELTKERVGVKGRENLNFVDGNEDFWTFSVTPIGIAVNALKGTHLSFVRYI